jgi:lipid A 3-O-deacylase
MADGTFAVLMFIAGFTDMSLNYCGTETGCLGRNDTQPRVAFSAGQFDDRGAVADREIYVRYDMGHKRGPFGGTLGFSVANGSEMWIGIGHTYIWKPEHSDFYAEFHAMTGLYENNGGLDLGGPIVFRSGIEFGYENRAGWRYALSYDHRSNADIYRDNPGVETYMFRVSVPLR